MHRLELILRRTENISIGFAIAFMGVILLLTVLDVIRRYVFGTAIGWAYHFTCVLMIGLVFMSLSRATRERVHIQFGFVYSRLPDSMQRLAQLLSNAAGVIVFALIGWQSAEYTIVILRESILYSPELPISAAVCYVVIALGSFLACLRLVLCFANVLLPGKKR